MTVTRDEILELRNTIADALTNESEEIRDLENAVRAAADLALDAEARASAAEDKLKIVSHDLALLKEDFKELKKARTGRS